MRTAVYKKHEGRDGGWFVVQGEWSREMGKAAKRLLFNSSAR